jgi:hypothetical protein
VILEARDVQIVSEALAVAPPDSDSDRWHGPGGDERSDRLEKIAEAMERTEGTTTEQAEKAE